MWSSFSSSSCLSPLYLTFVSFLCVYIFFTFLSLLGQYFIKNFKKSYALFWFKYPVRWWVNFREFKILNIYFLKLCLLINVNLKNSIISLKSIKPSLSVSINFKQFYKSLRVASNDSCCFACSRTSSNKTAILIFSSICLSSKYDLIKLNWCFDKLKLFHYVPLNIIKIHIPPNWIKLNVNPNKI